MVSCPERTAICLPKMVGGLLGKISSILNQKCSASNAERNFLGTLRPPLRIFGNKNRLRSYGRWLQDWLPLTLRQICPLPVGVPFRRQPTLRDLVLTDFHTALIIIAFKNNDRIDEARINGCGAHNGIRCVVVDQVTRFRCWWGHCVSALRVRVRCGRIRLSAGWRAATWRDAPSCDKHDRTY
jgi:hypothetical protein